MPSPHSRVARRILGVVVRRRAVHGATLAALLGVLGVLGAVSGCATAPPAPPGLGAERIAQIVADPLRTDEDRRIDEARRPAELLAFARVAPGIQVLDIAAGAGYTSQLLALAVGGRGRVWAQRQKAGDALTKRLAERPQPNLVVAIRPFEDPVPEQAAPLDLVTLVLNYHDITYLPVDRELMNQRLFAALKHGGHYVIVDHSARAGAPISVGKSLHRIDEAIVLAEVRKAGFELEAEGEFLRNPADDRDIASTDAKGRTDRFALRFVKP